MALIRRRCKMARLSAFICLEQYSYFHLTFNLRQFNELIRKGYNDFFASDTIVRFTKEISYESKQGGNGISRRHINGSKIARGLQKSSIFLQYPKNPKVGPNWRARWDALRFSKFLPQNIKKIEDIINFSKKVSQRRNKN